MLTAYMIAVASVAMGQTAGLTHIDTLTQDLHYPGRVAVNADGGIYVTDQPSNAVVEFDATGAYVNTYPVAGPVGIAVGAAAIYVSHVDGTVGVYDATFTPIAPLALDPAPMSMSAPNGLAVDPATGEIYVVDSVENRVMVFDAATGALVRMWGSQGSGMSEFQSPQAVALDPAWGHVIVADTDNSRLQVFDTMGVYLYKIGYRTLYAPTQTVAWFARSEGVSVDDCSNIYVADALMGTVRAFDAAGNELDSDFAPLVGYGPSPSLQIPIDVTVDGAKAYVVSSYHASVEVFDLSCSAPLLPLLAPTPELNLSETELAGVRKSRGKTRLVYPDDPNDITRAMINHEYVASLDVNNDRQVDLTDLELTVAHFGGATVEDFMPGVTADSFVGPLQPPHMIDGLANLCGRCHSMDGLPGGMLTVAGQENLCLSCHSSSAVGNGAPIPNGLVDNNSHPIGVPATAGGVAGPDPASIADLDLHLDGGSIRCATCHNPHDSSAGAPLLRDNPDNGALCTECHREAGAPTNHAVGLAHGPEYCTDCHDVHATGDNEHLTKEKMYSWYINGFAGGIVDVGFTDDTIGVGAGGFVDPAAGQFGFCDVCHPYFDDSQTPPVVSADFLALDPPHTAAMPACSQCHAHENGFEPGLALGLGPDEYVGEDTCAVCHTAAHTNWQTTLHSQAWANLGGFGQSNPACWSCHSVGLGAGGFVDFATTPQFANVQCENCHGPGSEHANVARGDNITVDLSAELCGSCHQDEHHPTFEQWSESRHAVALSAPRVLPFFQDACLECHSVDYRLAVEAGEIPPTVAEAEFDLECATCHNSHGGTGNPNQLRLPLDQLCAECHTSEGALPGGTPHHPQAETLHGEGGFALDGTPLVGPNSTHTGIAEECAKCHVHSEPFGGAGLPANTGHTFDPNMKACEPCHTEAQATELVENTQSNIQRRLDAISPFFTPGDPQYIDPGSLIGPPLDEYNRAKFNFQFVGADASGGVHNANYARALLAVTESYLGIAAGTEAFVGSVVCAACHETQSDLNQVHAHAHKLTKIEGAPPTFPPEGIYAGVPNTPVGVAWDAVSYIIGGYYRKARFITQLGNIMIGAVGPFDGALGIETQWNLEFPPGGSGLNWAFYETTDTQPKPYNFGCFQCHTTGPQSVPGDFEDWAEPGVQCEACHGPGAEHLTEPSTTNITIDTAAAQCGTCHTRGGDNNVVVASGGFIKHHEQYPELRASPHKNLECVACHEPHTSAYYDTDNAIAVSCHNCHSGLTMGVHDGVTFTRGSYSEDLTCESCHMAYASKSATAADASVIGPNARMGDIKTHIFNINTQPADYNAMFTPDGSAVAKDGNGEGAVTLDFVCLRCHNGIGNAPDLTLTEASSVASVYHIEGVGLLVGSCSGCHTEKPATHVGTQDVDACGLCHVPYGNALSPLHDGTTSGCTTCHTTPEETHTYLRDDTDQTIFAAGAEAECISCHRDGAFETDGRAVPPLDTEAAVLSALDLGTLRAWLQPGGFMAKYLSPTAIADVTNWIDTQSENRTLTYDPYLDATHVAADFPINGLGDNPAWATTPEHTVALTPTIFTATNQVKLKALYSDAYLYVRAEWPDSTLSMTRGAWIFDPAAQTWRHPAAANQYEKQSEDRFSIIWNLTIPDFKDRRGCAVKCHGNVPGSSEYTDLAGSTADIWHSKAARGLGLYSATDNGALTVETANESYEVTAGTATFSGVVDDKWLIWYMDIADGYGTEDSGRRGDAGSSAYSHNRNGTKTAPKWIETAPTSWADAMILTQAEIDGGEAIDADPGSAGYNAPAVAAAWANYVALKAVIPERILRVPTGSRADVQHAATWSDGVWVNEFKRQLLTGPGNTDDVQFDLNSATEYDFSLAVFDNCGRGEIPPGHTTYGHGQYQVLRFVP